MDYDERFGVRNEDIERLLRTIGGKIGEALPEGWGFGFFLFSYGDDGAMFWLSSANRADVLKALQEFIDREKKKV